MKWSTGDMLWNKICRKNYSMAVQRQNIANDGNPKEKNKIAGGTIHEMPSTCMFLSPQMLLNLLIYFRCYLFLRSAMLRIKYGLLKINGMVFFRDTLTVLYWKLNQNKFPFAILINLHIYNLLKYWISFCYLCNRREIWILNALEWSSYRLLV